MRELVRVVFGSHLFGTSTPTSDRDFKAVHLDKINTLFLKRSKDVIMNVRSKASGEKNTADDIDFESFELNKYISMICDGQTVALDMLFAPEEFQVNTSPEWKLLVKRKELFITKKAEKFVGYCKQQANKYGVKGTRLAAAKLAEEFFTQLNQQHPTEKLKDVEMQIVAFVAKESNEFIKIIPPNGKQAEMMIEICNRGCQWGNTTKAALDLCRRIIATYGDRAEEAESNNGNDWKALSHAVRIGEEAIELLSTGFVTLPRPNAQYLLDIKTGKVEYEIVSAQIEQLLEKVETASLASNLPKEANKEAVDNFILDLYHNYYLV